MTTPPPKGVPGNWRPKFVEEFNEGLGPKFASGWPPAAYTTPPMSPPGEVACYDPACVTVRDSVCTLMAVEKIQTVDSVVYRYATGVISTPEPVFAPGDFVEWRAHFDGLNHAALWTSAPDWPVGGECDTIEWLNGKPTTNYHGPGEADASGPLAGNWTGWHTFGSLYGLETAETYFDGNLVATLLTDGAKAPQWLLASVMLDQWAPIVRPSKLLIDYVRVFQRA